MCALHSRITRTSFVFVMAFLYPLFLAAQTIEETEALQQAFIQKMWEEHTIPKADTQKILESAKLNDGVLEAISRPWEAKPWYQYFPIFLTKGRLDKGLKFWDEHQAALTRAEQEYGIPAQIIVSIIGIETNYGSYTGKYSVLDALYSLGFYYPPRATFFRSELAELILLAQEEGFDLNELKGSYAGAMGYGQFISSSYRNYAVDFDKDGKRDILSNPVDAIGSVANYFYQHKWQKNAPVAFRAKLTGDQFSALLSDDLTFIHNWSELQNKGVHLLNEQNINGDTETKLLSFETEFGYEYWVGLPNFYVITRYNHSPLYAMVIYQFSEQLKQHRKP